MMSEGAPAFPGLATLALPHDTAQLCVWMGKPFSIAS